MQRTSDGQSRPAGDGAHARQAGMRQASAGFTLIEMIVVMAILALIAGLVMTRGPMNGPGIQAQVAAADMARLLRRARAEAIAQGKPAAVTVEPGANAVRAGAGAPTPMPRDVRIVAAATAGEWGVGPSRTIRFWPDGSSSGGRIFLTAGQRKLAVTVDWFTGRVETADAR
jgi:general secretion pathway protein H